MFPAEFAVSRARLRRRAIFVLCLRDITDRREAERQLRESELRYRMLVDHAPEAILVFDMDAGRYIDANANAERLFGMDSARLLQLNPLDLCPQFQPNGDSSAEQVQVQHRAASWPENCRSSNGCAATRRAREMDCEMRLSLVPSGTQRLIRISVTDISDRKRGERRAAAEREVLDRLTAGAPVPQVLEAITQLIESVDPGCLCSVSILDESGTRFTSVVAPGVPAPFRENLLRAEIGLGHGSCAAAVYLSRPALVADMAKDPFWNQSRVGALKSGLAAAWSTPIKSTDGQVARGPRAYTAATSGCPTSSRPSQLRMPQSWRESLSKDCWPRPIASRPSRRSLPRRNAHRSPCSPLVTGSSAPAPAA